MTTIKLKHPIKTAAGTTIDTVVLRRPTLKDLKASKTASNDEELRGYFLMAACATNLSPDEVDSIDLEDINTLSEALRGTGGNFPPAN